MGGGISCWVGRGGYSLSGRRRGFLVGWVEGDYSLSGRRGGFLVSGRWMDGVPTEGEGGLLPEW